MKSLLIVSAFATAAAASSGAAAQSGPSLGGAYGGGFIELLMTGRNPGAAAQPIRQPPVLGHGVMLPSASPFAGQHPGYRVAALPVAPGQDAAFGIQRSFDPRYERQVIAYDGPHRPGTIVIDTPSKFLYLVQAGGQAIRYGIGVGRPGFTWAGVKTVSLKRSWPDWTPPTEMLKRRPDLPRHMEGGPANPLGARALYLGSSLYRIHGTNEPHTIGQNVSSGCIRMMNDDVVDLYDRVSVGTKVVVL